VSAFALPGAAVLLLAWLLAAAASLWQRRWAALAALPVCVAGALLAVAYLLGGAPPVTLVLPIGLPGLAMTLALDGLSGFFLLLLMLVGIAACAAALEERAIATAPCLPLFIAAMALCVLAGDGFTVVLGFELMSLASCILMLNHPDDSEVRDAALLYLGIALFGAACLIPAFALLGGWDANFATLRAHPPEGWRAVAVLVLVLLGAGSKAGLAPLHVWLPPAHSNAPGPISALMSGAMTKMALYVMIRLLFDLCGPQPMWWSVPLLVAGAGGAVLGALRANLENDIKAVLACSTIENIGLIAIGLGLALAARAADMLPLAGLALGAALLHCMAHGLFKALLFLGAGATQHGAGTRRLDRLGGLIHRMPLTTAAMLAGAACLAALPPSSGFAGEWALFQAVLAGPKVGGLGMQVLVCVVAAMMALAVALAAAASVRLIGVGYLGRPRTPRCAAADEAGPPMRWALLGLAVASLLVGLFPGAVLGLATPALRLLAGGMVPLRDAGMVLAPAAEAPGYAPLAVAVLLALAGGLVCWGVRRVGVPGHRSAPAWECGFDEPPAWLPFGDPATQYSGAGFSQPLRRTLGAGVLGAREVVDMPAPGETRAAGLTVTLRDPAERWVFAGAARARDALSGLADRMQFLTIRRTLSVMVTVLVVFLALVAILEQR
jgi:formate hydrogenlyase subunit 3/multisubunit Na+/H+ antiporter MnhD subunit